MFYCNVSACVLDVFSLYLFNMLSVSRDFYFTWAIGQTILIW